MPNWEQFVAERLGQINLTPEERREVVAEIAAHLENCYAELLDARSPDPEGCTLAQVSDWNALCRKIRRAKEDRMSFARRVLMPGVGALVLALIGLKLSVSLLVGPQPCGPGMECVIVSADGPAYLHWLATLPLIGAFAAGLARRLGADPVQRLAATLFPALYLGAETLVASLVFPFYWRIPIYWVMIPAFACVLGAWPFLGGQFHPAEMPPGSTATA